MVGDQSGGGLGEDQDSGSELPLSRSNSSPSELDLGCSEDQRSRSASIDELPLSQPSLVSVAAGLEGQDGPGATGRTPDGGASAVGKVGLQQPGVATTVAVQKSVFRRRGRPNRALQEAMSRAIAAQEREAGGAAPLGGSTEGATTLDALVPLAVVGLSPEEKQALRQQATLSVDRRHRLAQRPIEGVRPVSPLAEALLACAKLSVCGGEPLDEEVLMIGETLLGEDVVPMASKRMRGDSLGVSAQKLTKATPRLAATLLELEHASREALETSLATQVPRNALLYYLDFCAYDETPLPVALRGDIGADHKAPRPTTSDENALARLGLTLDLGPKSGLARCLWNKQGIQKVLQTFQKGAMLLRVGNLHIAIICPTLCPIAILDRTTAIVLKDCQDKLSCVSRAGLFFQQQARAVSIDGYAANICAERAIADERKPNWSSLPITCDIHKTARCYARTFSLLDSNVIGMIRCAMSLRNGGAMTRFRRCMREEIADRLEVKFGRPPVDATRHKKGLLKLFVSHGNNLHLRRLLLALCPNGDWRSDRVEHYVQEGQADPRPRESILSHVTAGLITALCASQPALYPRHRWTGADLATDALGIMECCHRLLSTSYLRFAASYEPRPRAQRLLEASKALGTGWQSQPGTALALLNHEQPRLEEESPDAPQDFLEAHASSSDAPRSSPPGDSNTWATVNAHDRKLAVAWIMGRPLGDLILQRQTMEPLRQLLASQFQVASEEWEQAQQARVATALCRGDSAEGVRTFPVCIAASCQDEERLLAEVALLFNQGTSWLHLPEECFNCNFRAKTFRCISRMACSVKQLLDHPHRQFPFRTFLLIGDPDLAGEMLRAPPCLLDSWTSSLKTQHPTLRGSELHAKLQLTASTVWKDTSKIEARHATIRRLLTVASLQTHQMSLQELSAQWVLLQYRKRRVAFQGKAYSHRRKPMQARQTWGCVRVSLVPDLRRARDSGV